MVANDFGAPVRWLQYVLVGITALVPLVGVVLWGWSVREVILLYWAENVIIGFWQVFKMLIAGYGRGGVAGLFGSLFLVGFFTIHYGGFCAVHGMFVLLLTREGGLQGGAGGVDFGAVDKAWGPFVFVAMLVGVARRVWEALPGAGVWSLASMFLMRGLGVWQDFIVTGVWQRSEVSKLMSEPYGNVIVVHIAIIAAGFLAVAFRGAWPLLVLIVLGKFLLDLSRLRKQEAAEPN